MCWWSLLSSRETSVHELSAHGVWNGQDLLGRIQNAENVDWEEAVLAQASLRKGGSEDGQVFQTSEGAHVSFQRKEASARRRE